MLNDLGVNKLGDPQPLEPAPRRAAAPAAAAQAQGQHAPQPGAVVGRQRVQRLRVRQGHLFEPRALRRLPTRTTH